MSPIPLPNRGFRIRVYAVLFQIFCFSANFIALGFLAALLVDVFAAGAPYLNLNFLSNYPSRFPAKAGILSAWAGTAALMFFTALISVPLGAGAAVYLEEYARDNFFIRLIKLNIRNLAGIPSIIYGILGLTIFVRALGLGRSLIAGALTMAFLVLPIITIASQEALRAVPNSHRLAGYGIGMTRRQVTRYQVLPLAAPGMITGIILALSRAIGESAPLLMLGALTFITFLPTNPMDSFTALPIQIFNWTARPQKGFHDIAAAAIIVLLLLLILMNSLAVFLRVHYKRKFKELQ